MQTERDVSESCNRTIGVKQFLWTPEDAARERRRFPQRIDLKLELPVVNEAGSRRQSCRRRSDRRAGACLLGIATERVEEPSQPQDVLDLGSRIVNPEQSFEAVKSFLGCDECGDP